MADNDLIYISPTDPTVQFRLRSKDGGNNLRIPIHMVSDINGNQFNPATEATLAAINAQVATEPTLSALNTKVATETTLAAMNTKVATETTLGTLLIRLTTVNTTVGGLLTDTQLRASPIPVAATPGYTPKLTPDTSFITIPQYNASDTSGPSGTNATIVKILDIDATRKFLALDNNGTSDVELWFGAIPTLSNINQSPKRGKIIANNGGNRIWDVKVPTVAIYAISCTGPTVLSMDVG